MSKDKINKIIDDADEFVMVTSMEDIVKNVPLFMVKVAKMHIKLNGFYTYVKEGKKYFMCMDV